MLQPPPIDYDCLYNVVIRRMRALDTIFGDRVKLVLRQIADQQYSFLELPYLLVVPTTSRPSTTTVQQEQAFLDVPRAIVFIAQLAERHGDDDHLAACDIELAEKQLLGALFNWRPAPWYAPTVYAGMQVQGTRAPEVKVAFTFHFVEQFGACEEEPLCDEPEFAAILNRITFCQQNPCGEPCPPQTQSADEWPDLEDVDNG